MNNLFKTLLLTSLSLLIHTNINAQLTINTEFGDLTECDTMSRDIFLVWWDNDIDYSVEVDQLLDSMLIFKDLLLNDYGMQNPPNPAAGFFVNVYVHRSGDVNDFFSGNGFGNYVSFEAGGAFWTTPDGLLTDFPNAAHETAHIFQAESNSFGFNDDINGAWFFECSAEWFALSHYPDGETAHITSKTLTRIPHVPLWLGWANLPDPPTSTFPVNWQRENHQYALGTFFYYLSEIVGVPRATIINGYFANTNQTPQEYFFTQLGAATFRQHFIDFAARMTNDFDFLNATQNTRAEDEWSNVADPNDNNEFVTTLSDAGTNGWFRPADNVTTNGWSFNTIKLNNSQTESYTFEIKGDATGIFGAPSFFQGKVVVKNTNSGTTFHDVPMSDAQNGSITLQLSADDTEAFLIVASMPQYFEETNEPAFQLFPYEARITKGTTASPNIAADDNCIEIFPCPANNFFILQGDLNNYTIDIINTMGSVVQTITASGTSETIDISALPSGVHILRMINTTNNQLHVEQIIKQ